MYKNWCIIIILIVFFFNLDKIKEYEKLNVLVFLIFNVFLFMICFGEIFLVLMLFLNYRVVLELIVFVFIVGMML